MGIIILIFIAFILLIALISYRVLRVPLQKKKNLLILDFIILTLSSFAILGGLLDFSNVIRDLRMQWIKNDVATYFHDARYGLYKIDQHLKSLADESSDKYERPEAFGKFYGFFLDNVSRIDSVHYSKTYWPFYNLPFEFYQNIGAIENELSYLPSHDDIENSLSEIRKATERYFDKAQFYNERAVKIYSSDMEIYLNFIYCIIFSISISLSIVRILISRSD